MKKDTKLILIVLAGILAIVLLCIFAVQGTQNKAFTLEEQVNTAQSDIRVQEKRRVDLVYNLADCVMQYDKHEAETLTAIVEGRGSSGDIENVATAITAVSEAYPELKSNENYKELMNELSITENLIAEYRSNFNKQVKEYNRYVRQFPARLFLNILGYETQTYDYLFTELELKPTATVVDIGGDFVGISGIQNYVPFIGGVGPVTRAILMEHILKFRRFKEDKKKRC